SCAQTGVQGRARGVPSKPAPILRNEAPDLRHPKLRVFQEKDAEDIQGRDRFWFESVSHRVGYSPFLFCPTSHGNRSLPASLVTSRCKNHPGKRNPIANDERDGHHRDRAVQSPRYIRKNVE